MKTEESITLMRSIRNIADELFDNFDMADNGFGKCHVFGNILKEYDIMLIGLNPGGSLEDKVLSCDEEGRRFIDNPELNELIEPNNIDGLKTLYKRTFGDQYFSEKIKQTFWWNLCLARNDIKFGNLRKNLQNKAFDIYWDLTLEVINIVKPKIILTFVTSYNYIKLKLEIKNDVDFIIPNPERQHYYYKLDNLKFGHHLVKKVIGIHHLSWASFDWKRFGEQFKEDYDCALK